jgi:hypothetical protein
VSGQKQQSVKEFVRDKGKKQKKKESKKEKEYKWVVVGSKGVWVIERGDACLFVSLSVREMNTFFFLFFFF